MRRISRGRRRNLLLQSSGVFEGVDGYMRPNQWLVPGEVFHRLRQIAPWAVRGAERSAEFYCYWVPLNEARK